MVNLDTTIVRNTDLMAVPMDGDLVMMSISQGTYYGINPVGARIWALLEQPASVAVLCDTIVREFEVRPSSASRTYCSLSSRC